MRTAVRLLIVTGLTAGPVLGPAVPALAVATGTTVVKPAAEAWYRVTPTCGLPTGCADLSAAPSPYAPDTLHVGVNGGLEEARTYLQLDLASLPAGTKPTGGTLLLPVATGSNDGTRAPEMAKLQACAVMAPVTDVDGAFSTPPAVDCGAASAPAEFAAAKGADPAAFTVDLAPFTSLWEGGTAPGALALVPVAETAPPDSWHVAFSNRNRSGAGVVPISATVAFASSALDTRADEAPSVPAPPFAPAPAELVDSGSSLDSGAATSFAAPAVEAAPPLSAPSPVAAAPVQQVVPVAQSVVQGGFRYPAVFLLPLALAVAVGWLGRALTRDLADS